MHISSAYYVKKSKSFANTLSELKELSKHHKKLFRMKEVNLLTSLQSKYIHIFKRKGELDKKLNLLLDCLMLATSYYERLVNISNSIIRLKKRYRKLYSKAYLFVVDRKSFQELKKQDRDLIIEGALVNFIDIGEDIEDSLKILSNSMTHIDKLSFNIKSTLSILKEKVNGRSKH
jgi:hypothetical protein